MMQRPHHANEGAADPGRETREHQEDSMHDDEPDIGMIEPFWDNAELDAIGNADYDRRHNND